MPTEITPTLEVVRPIRRTVILLVVRIVLLLFLVDTIYAVLLLANVAGFIPLDWTKSFAAFLWFMYTIKFILLSYLISKLVIDWISTVYYVSGGHLIRQRGVLNITETVFQLSDIDSVVLNQSWLGRMLNFGDVTVEFTVARDKEYVNLYAITTPQRYEEIFSKFV